MALGLFAVSENPVWPTAGLEHAMAALGADAKPAIAELISFGLLVSGRTRTRVPRSCSPTLRCSRPSRTVLPEGPPPASCETVRQVRQADGLEPILRLAALWQRVEEAALRRTQQGTLYKKDRERIEDDPVLAGPIADSLEPLPDPANFSLALARSVGLVIDEKGSDRTVAAPAEFWAENAVHLPQMLASRWLGLRTWHEAGGAAERREPRLARDPVPPRRRHALAGDRRARSLGGARRPGRPSGTVLPRRLGRARSLSLPRRPPEPMRGRIGAEARARSGPSQEGGRRRRRTGRRDRPAAGDPARARLSARARPGRRGGPERPPGRPAHRPRPLRAWPSAGPPPRETFEHFLFVQPNFEVIAYRQGLNPSLIGQLSRFMTWVAVRRRAGDEAHARVGLPGPRRRPDARGDARPAGPATRHALCRRAWPRPCAPGRAAATA